MVDLNGYIEFPITGKLKVVDLTRKQVADLIKNRLISENLINDPLIFVDILNIKITVMGEVKSPQVLQVEDSRITLLEAITRTGGVTTNALLDRVAVIREEGNERKMYMHDIRSSDIFYSPAIICSRMIWCIYILNSRKQIQKNGVHWAFTPSE